MITILTHPDSDGICSAALLLSRFPEAKVFFTKPVSLLSDLKITQQGKIFICDIAMCKRDSRQIVDFLQTTQSEIIWFDHHPFFKGHSIPCRLITGEGCTSEIVFRFLEKEIDPDFNFLAVYGAIGDYTDQTDFIKSKLEDWDSRSLHFEASALFLGIKEEKFSSYSSKRKIISLLASGKNPSEITGLLDAANAAVKKEFKLYQILKTKVKTQGKIAYADDIPHFGFRGQSALFAAAITGKTIGISVFTNIKKQIVDITMRSRKTTVELNRLCEKAAESVGGSGGGHPRAAGARIPIGTLEKFLEKVNELI